MSGQRDDDPKETIKQNLSQLGGDLGDMGREIAKTVQNILSVKELRELRDNVNRTAHDLTRTRNRPYDTPEDMQYRRAQKEALRRSEHTKRVYTLRRQEKGSLAPYINQKRFSYSKVVGMTVFTATGFTCSALIAHMLQEIPYGISWVMRADSALSRFGFSIGSAFDVAARMFGVLALLFGIFGIKWLSRLKPASALRQFQIAIGDNNYIDLTVLASKTGRSVKKVRRQLRSLLHKQGLTDCYLDEEGQTLLIGQETYRLYMESKTQTAPPQEAPPTAETQPAAEPADSGAVADMEINSAQFIAHIRAINDALPEQDISDKLDKLEHISAKIFRYVDQHPDKLPQIRKFMDYYLPTTLKLMEAYRELDAHGSYGEVEDTKLEIKSAMDKINRAFENLFGNLLRNDLIHLSADISALEAMLAQEGLSEGDDTKLS